MSQSPTPILDRQAPLPPPAAPGSGSRLLIALGLVVVVSAAAVGTRHSVFLESLRDRLPAMIPELFPDHWTGARIVSLGLTTLLVAYASVAVHETGHLLGGLWA